MQTTQLIGDRGWLDARAAASVHRIDRQLGRLLDINEAGRTWAQQWEHWQTYKRDGAPIALHPDTPSIHQLGNAIDTDDSDRRALLNENGWFQTVYRGGVLVEPWHFEYDATRDQHINDPAPAEMIPLEDTMYFTWPADPDRVVYALSDALAIPAMRACGPGEAAIARAAGRVTSCDEGTLRMVAAEAGYDVKLRRTDVGARMSAAVWHGVQIDFGKGGKESPLQTLADVATTTAPKK